MNDWLNHSSMQGLDPVKRDLIFTAARQTAGKSGKSLAPVMMTLISNAHRKGIHFSNDEISLILEVLKEGKSPEEKMQIDQTIKMIGSYLKK